MIETAMDWWHDLRGVAPWFVVEALLPGTTLFALLLWLSQRFIQEGFARVRQYTFLPVASMSSSTASAQRSWWSCTCVGTCECLAGAARGLRRCCEKLLVTPFLPDRLANA